MRIQWGLRAELTEQQTMLEKCLNGQGKNENK